MNDANLRSRVDKVRKSYSAWRKARKAREESDYSEEEWEEIENLWHTYWVELKALLQPEDEECCQETPMSKGELTWEYDEESDGWVVSDDHPSLLAYGYGETPEKAWLDYWLQVADFLEDMGMRAEVYGDEAGARRERIWQFVQRYIEETAGLPSEEKHE